MFFAVDAITGVRENYNLKKNWISDPCLPQTYPWDGLGCSYENPSSPRIISLCVTLISCFLDLSYSGLNGSISKYFYQFASIHSFIVPNDSVKRITFSSYPLGAGTYREITWKDPYQIS
ncbi:hypothetical protein EJ110_NYTH15788 [Nymphaea thermarum]|nr:hypothetical protein EJ110_NYTH15788 [Nymphaea thermarum]